MPILNVYCDESCHLERDGKPAMVLGAVWCPLLDASRIAVEIRELKVAGGFPPWREVKWTKISPAKEEAYRRLIGYFFDERKLGFRALIAPKDKLDHAKHNQSHDDWYYKMYFSMLKVLLSPSYQYRFYLDIKDTRGGYKVRKLGEVLRNANYDYKWEIIQRLQIVRSHEVEQLQLADLLIGAVQYANHFPPNQIPNDTAKGRIARYVQERSGYDLHRSTLIREQKFNLFRWVPECEEGRS